jgi:hypothetical protein
MGSPATTRVGGRAGATIGGAAPAAGGATVGGAIGPGTAGIPVAGGSGGIGVPGVVGRTGPPGEAGTAGESVGLASGGVVSAESTGLAGNVLGAQPCAIRLVVCDAFLLLGVSGSSNGRTPVVYRRATALAGTMALDACGATSSRLEGLCLTATVSSELPSDDGGEAYFRRVSQVPGTIREAMRTWSEPVLVLL